MSQHDAGPRPRQVTIGGWVVAVTSAVLVITVFEAMANLNSVDTRDGLTRALTTGWAKELGISVDDALTVIRWGLLVAGAAAAVTGVLGIFVLQRHAHARIALTVAAVPVVLTAPFSGGLLGLMIAAATALLWSRPARDWFAGRPAARAGAARPRASAAPRPDVREQRTDPPVPSEQRPPLVAPPGSSQPPPVQGWGQVPAAPTGWRPAYPQGQVAPRAAAPPPHQLRIACILTWVFSLLTAGMYVLAIGAIAVARDRVLELLRDNPGLGDRSLSDDELIGVVLAASAFVILWCIAASVLALLAWRRHTWAWVLLLVLIGVSCLVELIGLPYSLLHLGAGITAFVFLLRPRVQAWFRTARPRPPAGWQPPPPGWQPPAPQQPPPERPDGKPPVW